ncbi:MAG: hypothetical protein LBG83_00365 [Oscillospiraceae bacterium]|jgi:hypothetical protein|nr:hypothetical protein [Oscillospiraceae bacterium]
MAEWTANNYGDLVAALQDEEEEIVVIVASPFSILETITIPPGKTVTLAGAQGEQYALKRGNGTTGDLFVVEPGGRFALFSIILDGDKANAQAPYGSLIFNKGTLLLGIGAVLRNNLCYSGGGVVTVGKLTINGATITGNASLSYGGGIEAYNKGEITMLNGEISDNTALEGGGGVCAIHSTLFLMRNGRISGNKADLRGGGVLVGEGIFTLSGGKISGNYAVQGGGIAMESALGVLNATGGEISGNTATLNGGGIDTSYNWLGNVYIGEGVVFSGNQAQWSFNRKPEDDALYSEHVQATNWTSPFKQGYNNYDISYTVGSPTGPIIDLPMPQFPVIPQEPQEPQEPENPGEQPGCPANVRIGELRVERVNLRREC